MPASRPMTWIGVSAIAVVAGLAIDGHSPSGGPSPERAIGARDLPAAAGGVTSDRAAPDSRGYSQSG
ncbi:MAG: hypothetical protein DME05_11005 [Candidatus Rokuibacteriota bacterium]|nr:MAG: hypothetical protein DME05_11005 [Candidatus Rokubacteria bacterium]